MHLTEVIRRHLGWCPAVKGRNRTELIHPDLTISTPPGTGTFKVRTLNWLGIFRNQLFIMALYFSVVGVLLSAFLGGIDIVMFFIGIVAGSLLSVFQGIRFWKTMNEVRDKGAIFLATLYDKTTITIILIVGMVPTVIFLGAVPAINMTMLNSIIGGFIFIMFWWVLFVTWIWESRAKRHLLSDGLMLTLAREA